MISVHLLFSISSALIFTGLFAIALRRPGPWTSLTSWFVVIFLGSWTIGIWMQPVGPLLLSARWLPFVLGGLFVGLLMAAPDPCPLSASQREQELSEVRTTGGSRLAMFDAYFWILVITLPVAIAWGYVF